MQRQLLNTGPGTFVKTKRGTTLQVLNESCAIEWPAEGKERIRKVVKRSNSRSTSKYASIKAGRMVESESSLERDSQILHDVDIQVLSIKEQHAKIHYVYEGKWHDHVPDLYVETTLSPVFREIKPDKDRDDIFILARTAILSSLLPKYGFQYDVLFESEIRQQPRLENATFVVKYGRYFIPRARLEQVYRTVHLKDGLTWGDVREGILGEDGLHSVCNLILSGRLHVNYETEWTDDARVMSQSIGSMEV